MNKDLLDQIPAKERPVASKLNSLMEGMQPSQAFQWELENQLMEKASSPKPAQSWFTKIMIPVGWGIAAIAGVLLLNWTIRSFPLPPFPAAGAPATQEDSFVESVRTGNICAGPLALGHGFSVFLTNPEKRGFVAVDAGNTIGEMRSFTWSADGERLAIVGNTTGNGNIHITDPNGGKLEYLLSGWEVGYLMDAAWSRDGRQLALWSSQNNTILYLLNMDGTGLIEKQLDLQILGAPQFAPDGKSIMFYGANSNSAGLFEVNLDGSQTRLINALVEDESSFAFSPDGTRLAYVAMDRASGAAILMVQDLGTGAVMSIPGSLPIPKGSGSSLPEAGALSWSPGGEFLVFDFGRNATDSAIYLAYADGAGLIEVADSAYAPAISADGKCLAYISEGQVFLMDLISPPLSSTTQTFLLSELPTGKGTPNYKQDKMEWKP